MRKFLLSLVVLALVSTLAGCGGASSGSTQQSTPGTTSVSFSIPIHQPGSQFTGGPAASSGGAQAFGAHPEFIDTYSNGQILGYLDALGNGHDTAAMTLNLSDISWDTNGLPSIPTTTTSLNGTTTNIPNTGGSSISWTSTISPGTSILNVVATVTLPALAVSQHTFGVVETNGECLTGTCLPYGTNHGVNDGYVLAEGQTSFTPGNSITLTLGGVLEAGYICNRDDPTCSTNFMPPTSDGYYHFVALPTDENGNAVIPSVAPSGGLPVYASETPYDNGGWGIVVTSSNPANVLSILPEKVTTTVYTNGSGAPSGSGGTPFTTNATNALGPFTAANPYQRPHMAWWDGEGFMVKCNGAGTAVIAMQMVSGSKSMGTVNGFNYSSANYPAAGALLGAVGSDPVNFGNGEGVTVTCTAGGITSISIN